MFLAAAGGISWQLGGSRKELQWEHRAEQGGNCYGPWKKVKKHHNDFCTSRTVSFVGWELPLLRVNFSELSSFLRA